MRFVIITGMSGGGKRTALKMLEDEGFYCVDNLPVDLLDKFVEIISSPGSEHEHVALGLDVRSTQKFDDVQEALHKLKEEGNNFEVLFMDCDDTLCMDPVKLRKFCETECTLQEDKLVHNATGKHVKAVVVVHVFGNLADMEAIMEIAKQYHLVVIEDATEALGTYYTEGKYAGKYAGTIGNYGAYSYNGNKIITTGGGGAVTSSNPEAVQHIRYLSTQAKDDPHYYIHNEVGYNYRMTNLQAALGVAQMEELPEFIRRKNANFDLYKKLFEGYELGKIVEFREGTYSNKWFYSLEIDMNKINGSLRDIITKLEEKGVQTRAIWGLIHEQVPFKNYIAYEMEKAPYYSSCILNFPCSTQITEEEIQYVAEQIKLVLGELANE